MPAGMSYDQLFRVPFTIGLIKQLHSSGNTLSEYYGLGITGKVAQQIQGRVGQYDLYNGTRSLSPVSAPGAPPTRLNRTVVGTQPITLPRIYNSIGIEDEKLFGTRALGMNKAAPVDDGAKAYYALQMQYAKQRINNSSEFMAAKMFSGGWGIKEYTAGSQIMFLSEFNAAGNLANNATLVPNGNKGNVEGIIDTTWSNPNADIVQMLFKLQVKAARVNGRRIKDIWVNGNTGRYLFNNSVIQAVGGSVYRIFDTLNPATEIGPNQKFPDTGVTVQFRALPDYQFHIYNQGYVTPGTSESFSAQTDLANWNFFIPDNVAIMTPAPSDWCGVVQGSEPMRWNLKQGATTIVEGFGLGFEDAIDPPRTDVKMLYNGAPVITEPLAIYYATVLF
jgi:hypothetical protein